MTSRPVRALAMLAAAAVVLWPARPLARQSRDTGLGSRGPATLGGTVVADDSDLPVGRAFVTVKGLVPAFAEVTSTDTQGRFSFAGLPNGDVTLMAAKATYLTTFYGAHDPFHGPAVPFTLDGGSPANVTLRLIRGAVIVGIVTGPTGRPQPGVEVSARQSRLSEGMRHLVGGPLGEGGMTDDRGRYRIWGLPPGEYVVEATPADVQTSVRSTRDADVQWATALASGVSAPVPPGVDRDVRFAPVYYPGTTDAAQLAPVKVAAGEEHDGVDLALEALQTADLRGRVVGLDGQPAAHQAVALDGTLEQLTTISDDAGRFEFRGVAPGAVTISARGLGRGLGTASPPTNDDLWGSADLTVSGEDQTGLTLSLRPGMTVAGRVAFAGTAPSPDPSHVLIALTVDSDRPRSAKPTQVTAATDGSFAFTDLAPGRYEVHPALIASAASTSAVHWMAKSVLWQGQELLDGVLEVAPSQDISGISIVFTDRQTDLRGTFVDSAGRPIAGFDVVAFAAEKRYWMPRSRRIQRVLLGRDGHFEFGNLPAGEYLLAAVTHVDPGDLADPDWLDAVAPLAIRVTLADGEHKVQDIRLGK